MNVGQQAASKSIAELVKYGVVESRPATDRRARRLRLSKLDWDTIRFEARLQRTLGESSYDDARSTLIAFLDALGGLSRVRAAPDQIPAIARAQRKRFTFAHQTARRLLNAEPAPDC
jgi:hypothetical protein